MHREIAGKLSNRVTKWVVAVVAILIFVPMAILGAKLTGVQNNEASSWLPASAESTKALDRLAPFQDQNDIPTVVVYHRSGGLTQNDLAAITAQLPDISAMDGVVGEAQGPIISDDREVAQIVVTYNFGKNGWNDLPDTADELRDIAAIDGVDVDIAGQGGQAADSAEAFAGIDGTLLYATLGVVILILLFTYRSPLLWIVPILSAICALEISQGLVYLLAKYADLTVNGQSQGILTVLVVGAGTDYALLLVARYREELRRHEDRHEAMAFALHRAAPAIIASAATVAVGMLCLTLAEMNSTAGLGPVLAIGVGVTLLVMLTVLPAWLVIFGRWMFWPKRPTFGSPEPTASGLWSKVGRAIAPRPRVIWVGTAVVLLIACLGLFKLDTGGLSSTDQYTKEFESVKGQRLLEEHGMVDTSSPIMIVANADQAQAVAAAVKTVPGAGDPDTDIPPQDGTALITVPVSGDVAAQAAFDVVRDLRDAVHAVPGADAQVGGTSALYLDIQEASHRDNLVIIPVVLVVVMLILMLLLRAVLSPVILIATVILSFGSALGISTLLFHGVYPHLFAEGEGFKHADASFPLFVFTFLVALGIDYNIFLMTRVREETQVRGTRQGSLVALRATGGVITSAGLVLAATFAVLGSLPLVFLAELGTAVALGVILDTIIVRSVLVTAINLDLGGKIWWPSALDRKPPVEPAEPAPEQEPVPVG
ncbi:MULTISPECIES: MMPL family transporter [unclassified Nocardioides]|uniref:MMPL family transporter n=1 Tax=unclassified Nocardioides TaxID=2615069 RepID=UPI0009EFF1F6|nr:MULTISPECIES: MMPL family transporter [unclassified Nocardioides]GAW52037.1 MMPL domain-containing protein [Nocardioides sp. PD653-B2]GAW55235.1 MMPL domain-containing protein [Nocardioides sp. PD653]